MSSYPYFHSSFRYRGQNDDFRKLRNSHYVNVTLDMNEIMVPTLLALLSARHVRFWWSRGPHKYLTLFYIPVKFHRFHSKIATSRGGILILGFTLHSKGMVGF